VPSAVTVPVPVPDWDEPTLPQRRDPSLLINQPDQWDEIGTWAPDGAHFFFLSFRFGGVARSCG